MSGSDTDIKPTESGKAILPALQAIVVTGEIATMFANARNNALSSRAGGSLPISPGCGARSAQAPGIRFFNTTAPEVRHKARIL